jgi:GNAT superfamily N-acetyltransferase
VREYEKLIGYAIFVVKPGKFTPGGHPHYQRHGWAMNDIIWLHPEHRNLGIGGQFVEYWEADLFARGIHVVHVNTKVSHPELAFLLKNCGYAKIEEGYEKRLR